MANFICFPGFGLNSNMYSNIDTLSNSQHIKFNPDKDFLTILKELHTNISPGNIAVGYSQGARLALATQLTFPETFKGLILISVNAGLETEERNIRKKQDLQLAESAKSDLASFYNEFDSKEIFDELSINQKSFLEQARISDADIVANQLINLGLGEMPNFESQLNNLAVPVLYISGSRDMKYTQLASKYRKKTSLSNHIVLDSDHRIFLNCPNTLSLAIEWFSDHFF